MNWEPETGRSLLLISLYLYISSFPSNFLFITQYLFLSAPLSVFSSLSLSLSLCLHLLSPYLSSVSALLFAFLRHLPLFLSLLQSFLCSPSHISFLFTQFNFTTPKLIFIMLFIWKSSFIITFCFRMCKLFRLVGIRQAALLKKRITVTFH